MRTFTEMIEHLPTKKILRNRLQLALQSQPASGKMINIFSTAPSFAALQPFQCALPFAALGPAQFQYWFDCFLERACTDLLDSRGALNAEFVRVLAKSESEIALIRRGGPLLARSLLVGYCQHFMGDSILKQATQGPERLLLWWHDKINQLMQPDPSLTIRLTEQAEREWQHLCVVWRWMHYCAHYSLEAPLRFLSAIESFYYSVRCYLQRTGNLPFDAEKLAAIVERLVSDLGLLLLDQDSAGGVCALYNSFYQLTGRSKTQKIPAYVSKLLKKNPYLKEVSGYQSCILAQFFILGVVLNDQDDSRVNVSRLMQESDFHPAIAAHLCQHITDKRYVRSTVGRKSYFRQLKDSLKVFQVDTYSALSVRIQQTLETREVLSYWLKYSPEQFSSLNHLAGRGMQTLFQIDRQLQEYAKILSRMKCIQPGSGDAPSVLDRRHYARVS